MNCLVEYSGILNAIAVITLAVITYKYVWLTKRILKNMERERFASTQPLVVGTLREVYDKETGEKAFHLHIMNAGLGPALRVSVETKTPEQSSEDPLAYSDGVYAITALAPGECVITEQTADPLDERSIVFEANYYDIYERAYRLSHPVDDNSQFNLAIDGDQVIFHK